MEFKELLSRFVVCEELPIDVQDDLVPIIKENFDLELYFWPADMDHGVYRGQISHWEYPKDETHKQMQQVIDITYASNLPTDWQRVICAKELIHILDPIDTRVSTEDGFSRLIEKIVLPPGMAEAADGAKVWNDRLGIYCAIAVLFPWAARQLFIDPYKAGKISIQEIAAIVDIPRQYAALVMHELWEEYHHMISM